MLDAAFAGTPVLSARCVDGVGGVVAPHSDNWRAGAGEPTLRSAAPYVPWVAVRHGTRRRAGRRCRYEVRREGVVDKLYGELSAAPTLPSGVPPIGADLDDRRRSEIRHSLS